MPCKPKWAPEHKLCAHHALGVVHRYNDGRCRDCAVERATAWNKEHPKAANERRRNWDKENPEASRAAKQNWKDEHPERVREQGRKDHRKRQGIVFFPGQSVESLLVEQGGKCANPACDVVFSEVPEHLLHVGHHHDITDGSPNVRGLLCLNCNTGGGRFDDCAAKLRGLAEYFESFERKHFDK